jgi:hypothetical protein
MAPRLILISLLAHPDNYGYGNGYGYGYGNGDSDSIGVINI